MKGFLRSMIETLKYPIREKVCIEAFESAESSKYCTMKFHRNTETLTRKQDRFLDK